MFQLAFAVFTKMYGYRLILMDFISLGLQGGLANQVCTLPWSIQHLPHQTVLHLQHPHHSAVCPGFQSLRYFPDAVYTFQWKFPRQPPGNLVCKYIMSCLSHHYPHHQHFPSDCCMLKEQEAIIRSLNDLFEWIQLCTCKWCTLFKFKLTKKLFLFRIPQVEDQLGPTQLAVSATTSLLQSHLVLFWTTRFMLLYTLSSCSVPAPSSPRPGLRFLGPLPKM